MHMDDLWFDVAIRGEHHLEEDLIARLQLSDGSESGPDADGSEVDPSVREDLPASALELF